MLISPTEPESLKALGKVSSMPETYGADILMISEGKMLGIQRKLFPDDLLASIEDDRLLTQLPKLAQISSILAIVGEGMWSDDDMLIHDYHSISRRRLMSLLLSIRFQFGIHIEYFEDDTHLFKWLIWVEEWWHKRKHTSLLTRRDKGAKQAWGVNPDEMLQLTILQSFPSVGPSTAKSIISKFGGVPLQWTVTEKEMQSVKGIGAGTTKHLYKDGIFAE